MNEQMPSPGSRKRPREMLIFIFPNLFTTANLFCGYFAIISAVREEWVPAAFSILLAAFSDGLDGRVARLTNAQSKFGEEYDSMCDLVSFGVAPAILVHQWALRPYGHWGWLASFLYLACAALRLTRFNVQKQNAEKRYFQGVPSPVAACTVATAVLFYQAEVGFAEKVATLLRSSFILSVIFVLAFSMVSTFRYRSFKDFKTKNVVGTLSTIVLVLLLILATVEQVIFPLFVLYVVSGPLAELSRVLRRRFKWYPGRGRSRSP